MSKESEKLFLLIWMAVLCVPMLALIYGFFFWLPWTWAGMGSRYFDFLPSQWQSIPFLDCLWLGFLLSQVKVLLGRTSVTSGD